MKAFLLAAGIGSRLQPYTRETPKCMLPIGSKPLLEIWLDTLYGAGVDEVLVNLHHLPDVVLRHLLGRSEPPEVHTVFEPELLGSAGTLAANRTWVEGEDFFLVVNCDNLTDFDLQTLIEVHRQTGEVATLTLFHAEHPEQCGIVEVDDYGRVVGFTEKPSKPLSDLANAGMYAFHPSALDLLTGPPPQDIGYDLLPRLVGRTYATVVTGYFRDIGTPTSYERAVREWRPTVLQ